MSTSYPPVPPIHPPAGTLPNNGEPDQAPAMEQQDNEAAAEPTTGMMTPGSTVRSNVMLLALSDLTAGRRWALALNSFIGFGQTVAFSVLLGLSSKDTCDQNLRLYLALFVARSALSLIFNSYNTMFALPLNAQQNANGAVPPARVRRLGTPAIDRRMRRLADLASLAGVAIFIQGNVGIFSSKTCSATSPMLFYGSVGALSLGWLYVLEVAILFILVVFFLPLALVLFQFFGVGEKKNEVGPLKPAEISKIPQVIYVPIPGESRDEAVEGETEASRSGTGAASSESTTTPAAQATATTTNTTKRRWSRLWRLRTRSSGRKSGSTSGSASGAGGEQGEYRACSHPFHPLPASQSSCPICLCDYEEPPRVGAEVGDWEEEPLRLLPCGHAAHTQCIDPWLAVSGRCPLCQRPASAKVKGGRAKSASTATNATGGAVGGAAAAAAEPAGTGGLAPGNDTRV